MISSPSSFRWLMLGVAAAAYALSFFQRFAPASIAPDLAATFQTSATSLGQLAATYFYVYTVMQIPTGVLADTLGPRRILLLGGLIGGVGSVLFGMAPTLAWALCGRTLVGLGVAVTFIAMLKLISIWFEERRFATLTGVCMVLGNLGAVLAGVPLAWMAEQFGWRAVFVGAGVVGALIGLACGVLVRDTPTAAAAAPRLRVDRGVILGGLLGVLRNRATWPPALIVTGVAGSFFAFGGLWATPYLMQVHGMGRVMASTHLSLFYAGFAVGCLIVGQISDRLARRKPVMVVGIHVYLLFWGLLLWVPLVPPLSYLLFALMGAATSSFTLSWACAKEVNPPQLSGMSTAVANMGGFLAGALLQPLVGWVMDQRWDGAMLNGVRQYAAADFRVGLGLMMVVASIGAVASCFLRETGCRNIWSPPR